VSNNNYMYTGPYAEAKTNSFAESCADSTDNYSTLLRYYCPDSSFQTMQNILRLTMVEYCTGARVFCGQLGKLFCDLCAESSWKPVHFLLHIIMQTVMKITA
jgi:hypothetical protein